jgi:hypothetical protein
MTDLDPGADLRDRMDRATADLLTPDGLAESVLSDGRRLRRRRHGLTFATGTAAAAAVAAIVIANLGGGSPSTEPDIATQPSDTAGDTPAPPKDSPSPITGEPSTWNGEGNPFPEAPSGWWDAPADQLLGQLEAALPDNVTITAHELAPADRAPGEPSVGAGWLAATLDSPTGPGGFEIILSPPDLEDVPDGPITYTDENGVEHTAMMAQGRANASRIRCGHQARYTDNCEEFTNSDGVAIGRVDTILQDGTITFYEATLLGPDGGLVYLSVWNATDEKPGPDTPTSAEVPPLTLDQLRDLVQDPAWTSYQP